ncbi:hypothetical protein [Streptomyces coelicoflavus]|uniref:hypothetical protein n=1 Tax=Streptomyces coelicoflavus TaxID=285562 RepID=UPI002E258CA3
MVNFFDLFPLSASELKRFQARHTKLERITAEAKRASTQFAGIRTGKQLVLRSGFVFRQDPADVPGDASDRLLPPPEERPPATRLASPRGIALKVFLTAAFVAQSRSPGERPTNTLPLNDLDAVSWVDLFATPAVRGGGLKTYASIRDKKARQLHHALGRLSSAEVQLIHLPNASKAVGKYEGFLLLHEQGTPYGGGENSDRYTVPGQDGRELLLSLPAGLFTNGWIHLLEDSELAFLLMIAWLHAKFGHQPVFAASDIRLLQFGLSKDAYEAHRMLNRFGLVEVEEDEGRYIEGGKMAGFQEGQRPKLHRFQLAPSGFDQQATDKVREVIEFKLS